MFLFTCWPSTNQEMLDINESFLLFWIIFLLILVQDADGDMYARSWYVLLMVFVLQVIRCWIWVEGRCRNVIVGRWDGHSHEPKQQFSSAVGIYFISRLMLLREILILVSTDNVCIIGRSCRNGFDMIQSQPLRSSFKLIISFTFSSLMFMNSGSERLDKFFRSYSWILVVPF